MMRPKFPLTIFYDGACRVCAAEMAIYRDKAPEGLLRFVDIASREFNPAHYGKTLEDFMKQLYVRDAAGHEYAAVDGFWAIWQAFPPSSLYGLLGGFVRYPVIAPLARLGYRVFARLRRYLPRQSARCDTDHCHPGGRKS